MKTIAKILVALAAVAGIVYVIATYGDKIVAWAKKLLGKCPCCCEDDCEDCTCEDDCDACPCECCCDEACECTCEEEAEEAAPVDAEEKDFEG